VNYSEVRVLVTGADGFIGSHLTEALIAEGARVTALSAYNSFDMAGWLDDLPEDAYARIRLLRGDIRDPGFMRRIMHDQQIVFHLAALIAIPHSYHSPGSYADTNVLGTLNVLEAAREEKVQRIVHTSTSEVYGTAITMPIAETHPLQAQSPYSASKIGADMMAEAFARSFDCPVAILRPFNTFGPRQSERAVIPSVIRQALDPNCSTILVGDTTPTRDLTFVSDTVAAFLALGAAPSIEFGSPYNAGSGHATSIGEVAGLILAATGCAKPIVEDRGRFRPPRSEIRALLADSTRLRDATGWTATVHLADGLERSVAWWRNRMARELVRRDRAFIM
jgi:NAD dependent epimerase/dehydratase